MINLNFRNYPVIRDLTLNEERLGNAALIAMFIGSIFVHEYSHIFAARCLFLDVKPSISCDFVSCQVALGALRVPEGSSLGYASRYGIVSAAGPISDIIVVALSGLAAWKMRDSYKKISALFAMHAVVIAINTFGYAASTHWSNWGDFVLVGG